ncbi:MAG: hypothetical protein KAT32_02605 [Candidatus Moranbacteria bacterium]|nr:hypothetical protein [Candidatus Moranbacteria bacterium]
MNNYQGKIFIIGINFLNEKGIILEHYQTSSIVIEVKESIIKLRRKNQRYRILTLFLNGIFILKILLTLIIIKK